MEISGTYMPDNKVLLIFDISLRIGEVDRCYDKITYTNSLMEGYGVRVIMDCYGIMIERGPEKYSSRWDIFVKDKTGFIAEFKDVDNLIELM